MSADRFQFAARVFAWLMGLAIASVMYVLFQDVYNRILRPPPFGYSASVYAPQVANLCPGETLRWQAQLFVRSAPTVLYNNRTIWSVSEGRTVIPDTDPRIYIWTEAELGRSVSRPSELVVPALPPGAYEVRTAASGMNTDADAYKVPFVVLSKCVRSKK